MGDLRAVVLDGSLLLALPIAVAAGLVSFLSPCVLPLVPGYLGYVTGLTGVELEQQRRGRLLAGMVLFVAGFSAVFILVGVLTGAAGGLLIEHQTALQRVLGGITIGLGLVYLGALPVLQGTGRIDVRPAAGLAAAPLLGVVFGLGWTACTGPTLGVIMSLSLVSGTASRGALLAAAYCVGLGLPFVVAGLAYRRAMAAFEVVRRHRVAVTRAGGAVLVVVGVLLVSGLWGQWIQAVQGSIAGYETVL